MKTIVTFATVFKFSPGVEQYHTYNYNKKTGGGGCTTNLHSPNRVGKNTGIFIAMGLQNLKCHLAYELNDPKINVYSYTVIIFISINKIIIIFMS